MAEQAASDEHARDVRVLTAVPDLQHVQPENPLKIIARLAEPELPVAPSRRECGAEIRVGSRHVVSANDDVGVIAVEPEEGGESAEESRNEGEDDQRPALHVCIVLKS